MSNFICHLKAFLRKKERKVGVDVQQHISEEMKKLAENWDKGIGYEHVKKSNWNDGETFEFIYDKYVKTSMDPTEFKMNMSDLRKFKAGLSEYNQTLRLHHGNPIIAALKLPKATLRSVPELKKFDMEITDETSFFRDFSKGSTKSINSFIDYFADFAKSLGSDQKKLRKLEQSYDLYMQKAADVNLSKSQRAQALSKVNEINKDFTTFYKSGAGNANIALVKLLEGQSIDQITIHDPILGEKKLSIKEKAYAKMMLRDYENLRTRGSTSLIRGLRKLEVMAKNNPDANQWKSVIDKLKGMIRKIEFEESKAEKGPIADREIYKDTEALMTLGFSTADAKNAHLKLYMPKYTLGIVKIMNQMLKSFDSDSLETPADITKHLNKMDGLVNRVKSRSNILEDHKYSVDPVHFLKQYASDIGTFNYRAHVKSTFKNAFNALVKDHLEPAKASGDKQLTESIQSMAQQITGIYDVLAEVTPHEKGVADNLVRAMSSLTYFRLLGGNLRSAARNATQRFYEFVEYGAKGVNEARKFYTGGEESHNNQSVTRQLQKFGLQWFDGKSIRSKLIDSFKDDGSLSSASRGALEDSYFTGGGLRVNSEGQLVRDTSHGIEKATRKIADVTSKVASKSAVMHRVVEDANRHGTFKTAYALAYQNLSLMGDSWVKKKMGVDNLSKQAKDVWIENQAGRMAYNATLDMHFEYAAWNRAKVLRGGGGKVLGQFMHYRFSMFDLMNKWRKEGMASIKAGDFTSEESWKLLRFGMLNATMSGISIATGRNIGKLFNNDVLETGNVIYKWLTTDRDNPDEVAELDKATFGQGGYYFLGPNINWLTGIAELNDRYMQNEVKFGSSEEISHYNTEEKFQTYQDISLVNAQLARIMTYSWPVFVKKNFIDALQLELGVFPTKKQRELRKIAAMKLGYSFAPKSQKNPYKDLNMKSILASLDRF